MHRLTSSLPAYACHVTWTWSHDTYSTWRNRVFNRSFRRKDVFLLLNTHFLAVKKKSSNSSVGLKKLDDKRSLNSANFCRCRSCDFTDLNTTTGKQIPKRDWFSWQEVMSFTGTSSGQTIGGCCSCEETPSWVASDQPFWSWNLHQRPFHWWDCWGTCSSHVPVKLSRNPPSVVPVISPVLILEPSPEAFPLVGLLGVPVPVCTDYRWVLFLWRNPFSGCQWSPLFDPGTSTRALPTGGTVGVPVPVMFLWSCQGTPLQWLPVISPVLILEPPPEAFPLVWLLGVPVPVLFRLPVGAVPVKKPLQWLPVITPFWSWNLHQSPPHWWDCWGTSSSHVPVKLSRNPPSVVTSDQPCFDTGTSTRGLSTGVTVGGTGSSLVQTTGGCCSCEETPSVVASDHPFLILEPPPEPSPLVGLLGYQFQSCSCEAVKEPPLQWLPVISPVLILEPPPEAFPLVWLLGVPVPVLFRPPVRLLRGFTYQKSRWPLRPLSSLCRILDRYRSCSGYR